MKIAGSSAGFAREIAAGQLTLLDWLDVCANELEIDGVVIDAAHVARGDADYLAQMKKAAADLGLTVAAFAADGAVDAAFDAARALDAATALGAPLLVVRAPVAADDPGAWGTFTDALKALAGAAKRANVTLALRNVPGTLCGDAADLPRAAKDVDSSWLRFALDAATAAATDGLGAILAKTVVAFAAVDAPATFATRADAASAALIERLARFRGFLVLERTEAGPSDAYHHALERFTVKRTNALSASAFVS